MSTSTNSFLKSLLRPSVFWLFAFIPITFILEKSGAKDSTIFFTSAMSIIPIAKLIGEATENLAHHTGDAIGGLLNATFGNAPELIIAVIALKEGLHEMVLASLIGAILANLLLATGIAMLVGGVKYHVQEYNPVSVRIYNSMMFIAISSMIIPSAFSRFFGAEEAYQQNQQNLNILLSIALLLAYILYLFFMIKTHPDFFRSAGKEEGEASEEGSYWSVGKSIGVLVAASVGAAFMSEVLVGAAEGTGRELGMSAAFIGIVFVAIIGGAAESLSAIAMARKNKVDLTMGIAMGSSIQIALFVAPVIVLLSFAVGPKPLYLAFNKAESGAVFMAVLLTAVIAGDGRSNWYKGIQLITLYALIAIMFYFIPEITKQ
ncbi:calcium/proton exchanger [Flavihumibacter rivuli]|uniref:calcium/proton exchanger n=1 Tax=Flavihumibacter rivuli TaxID=2838156 RepID=UPI001BDEA716|nr:calcium/proton exchanger [Flavihumibacter rivuli]ULQ57157.1 calcium/proton exchanger [Flavihumibacter rivuli]